MKALVEQLLERIRGAWRFRWVGLLAAWGVCLVGWSIVLFLPDSYEASARVFVDTRTALSRVTEGIGVGSDVDSQIQRVREALLGGPQLEEVVRQEELQLAGATPREKQDLIAKLRKRIQITSRDQSPAGLYVISYTDRTRERSLRVVDRLLNSFVENTLSGKREGSEQAQQFLREQIADYERRLGAAEERLAAFKKQHVGLMPGTQGDYFSRLQSEMQALAKAQAELGIAQRRREELQRQLRGEQPLTGGGVSSAAGSSRSTGNATAVAGAADNDTASRIREAQARLDDLLLQYTDRHPDVIALRATLEELKARQQADIDAVRRGDPGAAARIGLSANPIFQSIQLQLNQAEVDIAALRGAIADHQTRVADLRRMVDTAPEVEAQFARLNRDYDVTRAQYQALVERLERARLSEQAEETGVVRFEIVDPPSAAFKPVAPNRPLLIVAILLAGLAAGGALAYLLHQLRPVFGSVRQLNEITGLPVLGVVSMTWLEKHKALQRHGALVYAAAAFLLLLFGGVVFVVHPGVTQLLMRWMG